VASGEYNVAHPQEALVNRVTQLPEWTQDLKPHARKYFQQYLRKVQKLRSKIESIPLVVLVWGPGDQGLAPLYNKRVEIRDTLRERGCPALFSEEMDALSAPGALSARGHELIQAIGADVVVLIYGSYGSVAEFHDFSTLRPIASKLLVFMDSKHVSGYGFQGALKDFQREYRSVFTFEYPHDISACNLLTTVMEKVDALRTTRWEEKVRRNSEWTF
jgi:hypothetical protein